MSVYITALLDEAPLMSKPAVTRHRVKSVHATVAEANKHVNSLLLEGHDPLPVVWEYLADRPPVVGEWVSRTSLRRVVVDRKYLESTRNQVP